MAIQRATPTRINPSLNSGSSGRNAHASPTYGHRCISPSTFCHALRIALPHTIVNGATTQLISTLNPKCTHRLLYLNSLCSVSYWTLHRMGYIITSSPTAIGIETLMNSPRWRAFEKPGTKYPRMMPRAMARKTQITKKRSRKERDWKVEGSSGGSGSGIEYDKHEY